MKPDDPGASTPTVGSESTVATAGADVGALTQAHAELARLENENRALRERCAKLERQTGQLASLYTASVSLTAPRDLAGVLQQVREVVINLLGSEEFGVYALEPQRDELLLLTQSGQLASAQRLSVRAAALQQAFATRRAVYAANPDEPALVHVPLIAHEREVGALVIYRLLEHKSELTAHDRELIDLISTQVAAALLTARLQADAERAPSPGPCAHPLSVH